MRMLMLIAALATLAVGAVSGVRKATANFECPGKIVCPLTGEEICRCCCPLSG